MYDIKYEYFEIKERKIRVMIIRDDLHQTNLPLLIMHDGQNLYKDKEASYKKAWNFERQWLKHNLPCMIIVGIDSKDGQERLDEYSPFINDSIYKTDLFSWITRPVGGKAKEYAKFLTRDLLPLIKERYPVSRLKKDIAIAGSSMGGLFSLYVVIKQPKYFSKAACLSPSFWFNYQELLSFISDAKVGHIKKLYVDIGSKENFDNEDPTIDINYTRNIVDLLSEKGLRDNILFQQIGGAIHNERCWEKRIVSFVEYLFNK